MAAKLSSSAKVALLIALVFYGGLLVGRNQERFTYLYPQAAQVISAAGARGSAIATARSSSPSRPRPQSEQGPPTSFYAVPSSPEELSKARIALEMKIYGGRRDRAPPSTRPLTQDDLIASYIAAGTFDRFYRGVFAKRQIEVREIGGAFNELPGYGWKSILFKQGRRPATDLFIFHQGHDGSPFAHNRSNAIISRMLDDGYDVLTLCMPGLGWNRIENLRIKTWDGWGFLSGQHENSHGLFAMVDTGPAHFIKFFVTPVVSSIDFALGERAYDSVLMAGHSGGAWTTTVAAALDDRIDYSIAYAGSLPYFAKHKPKDLGDPEQYDSAFYRDFTYPLLYELASWGAGKHRIHYLVYSTGDECCFDATSTATLRKYLDKRPRSPDRDLRVAIVDNGTHDMLVQVFFDVVREIQALH